MPGRLFFRVIFPLPRPVIVTVVPVQSVFVYNDFVNPLYFLPGEQHATVQLTLYNFSTRYNLLFHGHPADHDPAGDHVPGLQPADRGGHDGRRGEGLYPEPPGPSVRRTAVGPPLDAASRHGRRLAASS